VFAHIKINWRFFEIPGRLSGVRCAKPAIAVFLPRLNQHWIIFAAAGQCRTAGGSSSAQLLGRTPDFAFSIKSIPTKLHSTGVCYLLADSLIATSNAYLQTFKQSDPTRSSSTKAGSKCSAEISHPAW